MPPKKEPEEEITGYNIEILSTEELKQYARLLESEIEALRKHCSFFQAAEDAVAEHLRIGEEKKKSLLAKDVELEKLRLKACQKLSEKRQWPPYENVANEQKQNRRSSATRALLLKEEQRHAEEEAHLKCLLREKNQHLEASLTTAQMARNETKKRIDRSLQEMNSRQRELFENSVSTFVKVMMEGSREFQISIEELEKEAAEGRIQGQKAFTDACENFRNELLGYYKNITKQDLQVIKKLQEEISDLKTVLQNYKTFLLDIQLQNAEISQIKVQPEVFRRKVYNQSTKIISDLERQKKIEQMAYENQLLEEKIQIMMKKSDELRSWNENVRKYS
ncbi:uncharacterized protein LOC118183215 [Stegodyphus dumicola]|uniref:uncharacterized protein LOC118183215 n=1 Tax=Stegodyphus dumicola TaxID=202533 RepID=UPI0015AD7248|nr:uncharacterized protein LOC118183215 [Stegodyphus dumicola]